MVMGRRAAYLKVPICIYMDCSILVMIGAWSGRGLSQMTNQQYKHGGGTRGIFPQEQLAYSYERIKNYWKFGQKKTAKC